MNLENPPSRPVPEELNLTRVFNAPRDLVFQAWADPAHLVQWWGPGGFTTTLKTWDTRPGGAILLDMNAPNGVVYPMSGQFVEWLPPEKLVFTSSALDAAGQAIFEIQNALTFAVEGTKTKLTLHARVITKRPDADQYLKGQKVGWSQSLDRLDALVTGPNP
jgi:uncharacterized protein YndB with AHSA1/START domain